MTPKSSDLLWGRLLSLRIFLLISAATIFSFIHFVARVNPNHVSCQNCFLGRYLKPSAFSRFSLLQSHFYASDYEGDINFTSNLLSDLMHMNLLRSGARSICIGSECLSSLVAMEKLGISNFSMISQCLHFKKLLKRCSAEKLPLYDNFADFIFSRGFHIVSVPALFVIEVERALKPGGVAALLVKVTNPSSGSLVRTATQISLLLKSSKIMHVRMVDTLALLVFRKANGYGSVQHYHLPEDCPSITSTGKYIDFLEPILKEKLPGRKDNITYLTNFMNVSSWNRMIYIDVGAGQFNESSIAKWFLPSYPRQHRSFEIYAMDHSASVLLSYADKRDITFIYYPELSQSWAAADSSAFEELSLIEDEDGQLEGFDFLDWLKETVDKNDFVVMKLDAHGSGLKLLHELLEGRVICLVHEIFLQCFNDADVQESTGGSCLELFHSLRGMGIFVHQLLN